MRNCRTTLLLCVSLLFVFAIAVTLTGPPPVAVFLLLSIQGIEKNLSRGLCASPGSVIRSRLGKPYGAPKVSKGRRTVRL